MVSDYFQYNILYQTCISDNKVYRKYLCLQTLIDDKQERKSKMKNIFDLVK